MTFLKKIAAVLLAALLLVGCAPNDKRSPLPDAEPQAPVISDGGCAIKQGNWIYFINGDNFTRMTGERFHEYAGALVRMSLDGSRKDVVVPEDVSVFNIQGDTVYLCLYENDNSYAATVNVDGTDLTKRKIDDVYYGGCYACADGCQYYTKNYCLYRFSEGKETKLTDYPVYHVRAAGNYAYFTREEDGSVGSLFRVGSRDTECVQITREAAYSLYASESVMYYYMFGNGRVYAYDTQTLTAETVIYDQFTEFAFFDEFFVASYGTAKEGDAQGIYVIPKDGSGRKKISEFSGKGFAYLDGWLYYINITKLNYLYRVRPDGTGEEQLAEEFLLDVDPLDPVEKDLYFFSDSDYGRIYRLNTVTGKTECVELEEEDIIG